MNKEVKNNKKKLSPALRLVILCVMFFLSAVCFVPEAGVLRTLPFMLAAGFVAAFLKAGTGTCGALAGVFTLLTYLLRASSVWMSVLYTVLAMVLSFAGVYLQKLTVALVKTKRTDVRKKCMTLIVLCLVVCSALVYVFCGNIISYIVNNNENTSYLEKHYGSEIEKMYTSYDLAKGEYCTYVTFDYVTHGENGEYKTVVGAENECFVYNSNGKFTDKIRDFHEEKMLAFANEELGKIIANNTNAFQVVKSDVAFEEGEILSPDSAVNEYLDRVDYVVCFYSIVEKKEMFESLCRDAVKNLNAKGFEFRNIIFCAGTGAEMKFTASVTPKTSKNDVASLVKTFDEKVLSDYGVDEKKLLDYWNNL